MTRFLQYKNLHHKIREGFILGTATGDEESSKIIDTEITHLRQLKAILHGKYNHQSIVWFNQSHCENTMLREIFVHYRYLQFNSLDKSEKEIGQLFDQDGSGGISKHEMIGFLTSEGLILRPSPDGEMSDESWEALTGGQREIKMDNLKYVDTEDRFMKWVKVTIKVIEIVLIIFA